MLQRMSVGIAPEHRDALLRHKQRCLREFEFVGFLGYRGDDNRLPRGKCFIGRSTFDGALSRKQQEKEKSKITEDVEADEEQATGVLRDEQVVERIRQGDLKSIFITGEGGMGKTEYTRMITYRLAELLDPNNPRAVPVHFELKKLTKAYDNGEEFFQKRLAPTSHIWLTPLADEGKVVFIFDGLDEVGIDQVDFHHIFKTLVERFPECSWVLAGRPGTLGDLDQLFSDAAEHELKPLELSEIQYYVNGYFAYREVPDLAPKLLSEIQSNRRSLFPIIQTPFMLAFACDGYYDPKRTDRHELPSNPAELIESGLKRIFARRRRGKSGAGLSLPKSDELCFEALSTLAAFTLVEPKPGDPVRLTFSTEAAEKWLVQNRMSFEVPGVSYRLQDDGDAKELLDRLAPQSGILVGTDEGKFAFSNRVIAEFLAARWIVRHGYPNWPYSSDEMDSQYTKPFLSPETAAQRLDRQIMDFLGDYVWTIDRSALVQAVCFELGRLPNAGSRLMRFVRWTCKQLDSFEEGQVTNFQIRKTLVTRVFRTFQALQGPHTAEQIAEIETCAHRLIPATDLWWNTDLASFDIQCLPASCKAEYSEEFLRALEEASRNPKENWGRFVYLTLGIASGLLIDAKQKDRAFAALSAALKAATEDRKEDWSTVEILARGIVSGFATEVTWKKQAFGALSVALDIAIKHSNSIEVSDLTDAIVSGFATDAELKKPALDALCGALDIASKRSMIIDSLCGAIASGFAGDAELKTQALDALLAVLELSSKHPISIYNLCDAIVSGFSGDPHLSGRTRRAFSIALHALANRPKEKWDAISCVACTIASNFVMDVELKKLARESMLVALNAGSKHATNRWHAINGLFRAIALNFPADDELKGRSLDVLLLTLDATGEHPTKEWDGIDSIVRTIVSFAVDEKHKTRASKVLLAMLVVAEKDREGNWLEVYFLVNAIATSFGCDAKLRERVLNVLSSWLNAACMDPKAELSHINLLANTVSSGFATDANLKGQARDALFAALNSVSTEPRYSFRAIGNLAVEIASGFGADEKLKHQACDSFLAALDAAGKNPKEEHGFLEHLANAITSGPVADTKQKERAFEALLAALVGASNHWRQNTEWIGFLANTIVSCFGRESKFREHARDALVTALSEAAKDRRESHSACGRLAQAIGSGFPGDPIAAAAIVGAECRSVLDREKWDLFVTLHGDWQVLCEWAGPRGERLGLTSGDQIIEKVHTRDSDGKNSSLAVLVAPREKIRRGLSAELLEKIVQEESLALGRNVTSDRGEPPHAVLVNASKQGRTVESQTDSTSSPMHYVFRQVYQGTWEIAFKSPVQCRDCDLEGFEYIARLLEVPNSRISDLFLQTGSGKLARALARQISDSKMDRTAKIKILERIKKLGDEEKSLDVVKAAKATEELDKLRLLVRSSGKLGSRKAPVRNSELVNAQKAVKKNLNKAYEWLETRGFEELAKHLRDCIKADDYAQVYRPVGKPEHWEVSLLNPSDLVPPGK